ncbi:hypothetical protein IEQ34_018199 [Dendrobium chrysotoxum]|uniref:Uncharacterized protein n=1 Tax=Dendrobium chrysotoxum TaxID=161865 RepID=A0AAV7GDR9_DENCH|nr:hypothetical protein IEQ34_018199 [Dendrobium chrysotoxum]
MATFEPSFSVALNTSPNPPLPIMLAAENPLVASISCENVSFRSWRWNVATLMLSGSFSFPIFQVVAACAAWRLPSIFASSASRRRALATIAHTITMQITATDINTPSTTMFAQAAAAGRLLRLPKFSPAAGGRSRFTWQGDSGTPQRPGLFAYWLAGRVLSWPLAGIGPVRLLSDRSI